MKTFILVLAISWQFALIAQVNVFECTPQNSIFLPQELNNGTANIEKPCLWLNDPQGYETDCEPAQTLRGFNEIHLTSDFHAKAGTAGSDLHLKVGLKANFEVAAANYLDLNNILKLKKFEVACTLPASIGERVNNFINKIPNSLKTNPYLDWELRVVCEFYHPSLSQAIVIDGFYDQQYYTTTVDPIPPRNNDQGVEAYYQSLGGYTLIPWDYKFVCRFSPPETGKWTAKVKIYAPNEYYESDVFLFNVVESGSLGYVKVGDEGRYLKLGDRGFMPIGVNVTWPFTDDFSEDINQDLKNVMTDNNGFLNTELYRWVTPIPQVYDDFKKRIGRIADNGGNMIRIIMHPFSMEIEYEELGNYTRRLYQAQEMDKILEYCEQRGVYILWDFQIQYTFENGTFYSIGWDKEIFGEKFCYRSLVDSPEPHDFFSNDEAKTYYKQRYRYLVARYGYSTNIAIFELFSEIYAQDKASPEFAKIVEQWHGEMGTYVKSFYNGKIHLLTANYAGHKSKFDDSFASPSLDIMSSNQYNGYATYSNTWSKEVSEKYLNQNAPADSYVSQFVKPLIFSEFDAFAELNCDYNHVELKRGMWQTLFSGIAGGFSWMARARYSNIPQLNDMRRFMEQVNLDKGHWHPGASQLYNGRWLYNSDYQKSMDDNSKKADISYLRSGDGNFAFGVITNKTYNIYTQDDCLDLLWDEVSDPESDDPVPAPFGQAQDIFTLDEDLKLRGMNPGKYYITYFYPHDLSTPIRSREAYGPKLNIDAIVGTNANDYLVLFMARRKNHDWSETNQMPLFSDEPLEANQQVLSTAVELDEIEKANQIAAMTPEEFTLNSIVLYPNPSENFVTLASKLPNLRIALITLDNKELSAFKIDRENTKINLAAFEKGIYLLQIYQDNVYIGTKKIIKL